MKLDYYKIVEYNRNIERNSDAALNIHIAIRFLKKNNNQIAKFWIIIRLLIYYVTNYRRKKLKTQIISTSNQFL